MDTQFMDDQSMIKSLDESVAHFNLISERKLIDIAMEFINRMETEETGPTLLRFRMYLRIYDKKTKHAHQQNVDELIFKIDQYFECANAHASQYA